MSLPIPKSVDEITAEWMDKVLRAADALTGGRVAGVERRVIGAEKGFLSSAVVANLHYDGPAAGAPASVFVKLEPAAGSFRDAERDIGAFEREIRFYREVRDRVRMRLPRIFHTAVTPEGSVLVMEDLSRLESGDQVHGLRHEQVLATVREIAKLHAAYWDNDALRALAWVPDHDPFWEEGFAEHWPGFARAYEVRIGRDAVQVGESVMRHLPWLEERITERPTALIHSDLRGDNVLFGALHTDEAAVILDWQLVTKSLAAIDPTRLLGGSEPAAERKGHQLEVLAAWHEGLLLAGVTGYEFEQALQDFRLGVLYSLLVPVKAYAFIGDEPGARSGRLMDAQAERCFASALELDAGSILP
jgi:hypothetical protein